MPDEVLPTVEDIETDNRIDELEKKLNDLTSRYTELYGYVKKISKPDNKPKSSETKTLDELFN